MLIAKMKFLSCCCQKEKRREIVLLLVGLDNAGKTTAAKGLAKQDTVNVLPTAGFSTVKLRHKGFNVIIYDLGGGPQIREIWSKYFSDIHGVIFVIDASDMDRLNECRREIKRLVLNEKIAKKPILVLANKQDKPGALDEIDIIEKLSLEPLINAQKCPTRVEMCAFLKKGDGNGKIDPGLLSGYRWLLGVIIKQYKEINDRVVKDSLIERRTRDVTREAWRRKKGLIKDNSTQSPQAGNTSTQVHSLDENIPSIPYLINNHLSNASKEETSSLETVIRNGTAEVITHLPSRNPFIVPSPEPQSVTTEPDSDTTTQMAGSSASSTLPVREQLERKSLIQRKKSFSAHSRRKKSAPAPPANDRTDLTTSNTIGLRVIQVHPSESDEQSPVPQRSSPFMELPPVRPPGTSRPMTTRSLGRTGKAWDLDLPLEVSLGPPDTKDKSTNIF